MLLIDSRVTVITMAVSKSKFEKNLLGIRERISSACECSGRNAQDVRIVAVTKSVDVETIKGMLDLGLTDLGESRVQQLCQRVEAINAYLSRRRNPLTHPIRWHMIGHLQRNKVKDVLQVAEIIQSVDSLRLAEEINARAERMEKIIDVLLQVNCSNEAQKYGVAVGAAAYLGELICTMKHLRLVGLMTMAPLTDDSEQARPSFARLRELFEEMRNLKISGDNLKHLSMGMSHDYEIAVEEGATIVRIGTALFR